MGLKEYFAYFKLGRTTAANRISEKLKQYSYSKYNNMANLIFEKIKAYMQFNDTAFISSLVYFSCNFFH